MARVFVHAALVVLLTLVTQVGGVAYLLSLAIVKTASKYQRGAAWTVPVAFFICYAGISFISAWLAPQFGRVPLPCFPTEHSRLATQSPMFCILNRHYVRPELRELAVQLSSHVDQKFPGTTTLVLDANFPFFDDFPLLPHLSHDDGRKLDLAYYYQTSDGVYLSGKTNSPIGYWAFEKPNPGSDLRCADRNEIFTLRWNLPWFMAFTRGYELEKSRTSAALEWLVTTGKQAGISRIFIEPHLVEALNVENDLIRFQGCRAARHDDHIHLETKP